MLVAFISYFTSIVWPVMAVSQLIDMTSRGKASLKRIGELLDAGEDVKDRADACDVEKIDGNIEFRNLTFHYPDADYDALSNVSFKISAGENVGIIGKTGSGKTTLVDLILRTYNVPDGALFVDGHDVNDITIKSLRDFCAYVPQDNFLFSDTIERNIAFATDGGFLPHRFVQMLGGKYLAGVGHEQLQNGIFRGGEVYTVTVHCYSFGSVVQTNAADGDHGAVCRGLTAQPVIPPQLGADPRQHLHGHEGLCDVVIRAHIQPQYLILGFRLGGEENDGSVGYLPDSCGGGDAVHYRHHNIQQNEMDILFLHNFHGLLAGECLPEGVPFGA
jgi:hypothetical protein